VAAYFLGVVISSQRAHRRTRIGNEAIRTMSSINTTKVFSLTDVLWHQDIIEPFFTALSSFSHLKLLNLSSHLCTFKYCLMGSLGWRGTRYLCSALDRLRTLRVLQLESAGVGNKGAELLASSLVNLQELRVLSLANNYIGDRGKSYCSFLSHFLSF